jgi:hypothetical protein
MSELPPENPASVTVTAAPIEAGTVGEETALAAGAALSLSGEARAEASDAATLAQAAIVDAESARAAAAAAESVAVESAAAAETTENRLNRLFEMITPIHDDYAERRAAAEVAANSAAEVTEVDATGSGATGSSGGTAVSDSGHDNGTPPVRRGLRRGRK